MRRIHVNPDRDSADVYKYSQVIDAQIPTTVDFSTVATDRGTSVSSVEWDSYGRLSVTNQALASDIATANVSAGYRRDAILQITATFADTTKDSVFARIRVENPRFNY